MAPRRLTLQLLVWCVAICALATLTGSDAFAMRTAADEPTAAATATTTTDDVVSTVLDTPVASNANNDATTEAAPIASTHNDVVTEAAAVALAQTDVVTEPVTIEQTPEPTTVPVTSAAPTPTPFTLAQKAELCKQDFHEYNRPLRLMSVDPKPVGIIGTPSLSPSSLTNKNKYPRIFCYVNTISPYHKTHAQMVADTWGQRCDKLVFFSNDTGTMTVNKGTPLEINFPILKMKAPADYWHLWMKHKESLQYIYEHYRHDFDWFYKADDDAYVVMDNFRDYLRRPEIVMNHKRQPMHLGHRFNLTADRVHGYIQDKVVDARWWTKWDRWVFNSGGPGYAMNRLYLNKFVSSMNDRTCLSAPWAETQPEDTATAYCMSWHDVAPWDTRDLQGRPRWHADDPGGVYRSTPDYVGDWWIQYHKGVGGMKWGDECCAPDSVGYHYVKGKGMHHMERQLYFCREGDDVPDLQTFNKKYGLGISEQVLIL